MPTLLERAQAAHTEYRTLVETERKFVDEADARKDPATGKWTAEDDKRFADIAAVITAAQQRAGSLLALHEAEAKIDDLSDRFQRAAMRRELGKADKLDARAQLNAELRKLAGGPTGMDVQVDSPGVAYDQRAGLRLVEYEQRDVLTSGSAGNTVPRTMLSELYDLMVVRSAIFQLGCRVITTQSGEALDLPKKTVRSTAAIVPEGNAIGNSEPTSAKVTYNAYKYGDIAKVSREIVQDTTVDLVPAILADITDVIVDTFGADAVFSGNGSTQPQAIVPNVTVGVTGATGQTGWMANLDPLIDLFYSVIEPHRRSKSCGWLMLDATAGRVRKLKDSDGQYLWQPSVQLGEPDLLMGKRVVTDPNVPAAALNARSVLFGNFYGYVIRQVRTLDLARSDDAYFANDMVGYRVVWRVDSKFLDTTGCVKAYVGAAS